MLEADGRPPRLAHDSLFHSFLLFFFFFLVIIDIDCHDDDGCIFLLTGRFGVSSGGGCAVPPHSPGVVWGGVGAVRVQQGQAGEDPETAGHVPGGLLPFCFVALLLCCFVALLLCCCVALLVCCKGGWDLLWSAEARWGRFVVRAGVAFLSNLPVERAGEGRGFRVYGRTRLGRRQAGISLFWSETRATLL